jgi:integrase
MKTVNLNEPPPRRGLTDARIGSLPPAPKGKRKDYYDITGVPKLLVRVTDTGSKTFLFRAYFPGQKFAARRFIGKVGEMKIEQARDKAREWHKLLEQGRDPQAEAKRQAELAKQQRLAELRATNNTFLAVAEAYFAHTLSVGRKKAKPTKSGKPGVIEREIRKELISCWAARRIDSITAVDATEVLDTITRRGSPWQAYTIYERIGSLWKWAKKSGRYGPLVSPLDGLSAIDVISFIREPRQRHLNDTELRALWEATSKLEYPWQPLYRLLILTGARLSDISNASWPEIDLNEKMLIIPPSRFKGGKIEQAIPLTKEMLAILNTLPRFKSGDYLFSADHGVSSVKGFSKPKLKLDAMMPDGTEPWVVHDIRRTTRSHFSALAVEETVREVTIGHVLRGMAKTYNRYSYKDEKRLCLQLWQKRLTKILNPPTKRRAALPDNVTQLPVRKRG